MTDAPLGFQLYVLSACALFALWPFSRLVHVFSAPLGYLGRPYLVYRSRDTSLGAHRPPRGWETGAVTDQDVPGCGRSTTGPPCAGTWVMLRMRPRS